MSFAVDVNILLYASDRLSPHSAGAAAFLEECRTGRDLFCLPWLTIISYLRMVTHAAVCREPLPPRTAMENVDALLQLPHVRTLTEQDGFWQIYREVAAGLAPRGGLVPDVHLAALLRQHGVRTFYTNDRGFRRFEFLEVRNPLE